MNRYLKWLFPLCCMFLLAGCSLTDAVGSFMAEVFGYIGVIFTIFGLWYIFWPAMGVLFLSIGYMVNDTDGCYEEHPVGLFFLFIAFFGLVQLTNRFDMIGFISGSFLNFVLSIGGYFGIGLIWSIIKVYLAGRDKVKEFNQRKEDFLSVKSNNEEGWYKLLSDPSFHNPKPDLSTNNLPKKTWLVYWPFSVFDFFLHDFVRRFVDFLVRICKDVYRYVYEKSMGDVLAEYRIADEMKKNHSADSVRSVAGLNDDAT